jgi:hypothetical protein
VTDQLNWSSIRASGHHVCHMSATQEAAPILTVVMQRKVINNCSSSSSCRAAQQGWASPPFQFARRANLLLLTHVGHLCKGINRETAFA